MICSCLTCSDHAHHPLIEKKKSNYWSTPKGITRRINYLAQELTYMTVNGAIKLYGNTHGVKWLQWLTVGDDRVCPICDKASAGGRSGYYKSSWFMPRMPAHAGCRCQWITYYDPKVQSIGTDLAHVNPTIKTTKVRKEKEAEIIRQLEELPKEHLEGLNQVNFEGKGYDFTWNSHQSRVAAHYNPTQQVIDVFNEAPLWYVPELLRHEVGHHIHLHQLTLKDRLAWNTVWRISLPDGTNELPSEYATSNDGEGFAETYKYAVVAERPLNLEQFSAQTVRNLTGMEPMWTREKYEERMNAFSKTMGFVRKLQDAEKEVLLNAYDTAQAKALRYQDTEGK